MRKGFLHGMSNLLEIFSWMQGMDLQLRQASVHLDHEFEWEHCFRLHISFIAVIALVTKWCATDRVVYIKTIRMIFKKLFEDNKNFGEDFVEHNIAGMTTFFILTNLKCTNKFEMKSQKIEKIN